MIRFLVMERWLSQSLRIVCLVAMVMADHGVGLAQSGAFAGQGALRSGMGWRMKTGAGLSRRPTVGISVIVTGAARQYSVVLPPADHGRLTTTFDYRVTTRGLMGSIGLQPSLTRPEVDAVYLNPAASMRFEQPEVTVGARLSYRFR